MSHRSKSDFVSTRLDLVNCQTPEGRTDHHQKGGTIIATGSKVTKYDTAEENKIICGYQATYMPDEYEDTEQLLNSMITISVDARELNDPATSAMPLPPGETARAVEVKGMDNALVIDSENGASIRMRKQMSESLEYKSIDWWNPEDGLLIGTHSFGEYFIQVGSVSVPEEVLMGIFSD